MGMKNNIIVLPLTTTTTTLLLLFILLSVTPTRATEEAEKVLDAEGNPLEWESEYYIRTPVRWHGGIKRSSRKGSPLGCPLYLIKSLSPLDPGTPVKFIPDPELNETSQYIHLSSKLQIDSGFSAHCRDDGIWRLKLDPWTRSFVVIASGSSDVPRTWFTIEETHNSGHVYKIATEEGHRELGFSKGLITGPGVLGTVTSNNPEAFLFVKKEPEPNYDDTLIRSVTN